MASHSAFRLARRVQAILLHLHELLVIFKLCNKLANSAEAVIITSPHAARNMLDIVGAKAAVVATTQDAGSVMGGAASNGGDIRHKGNQFLVHLG